MQYETLKINDNGTARVKMSIDGHVLEQDFYLASDFEENVKQGMAVFKSELDRNIQPDITVPLETVVDVTTLPTIPPEDLLPEQSVATGA